MYLRLLEHATSSVKTRFLNIVSCYMENYESAQDKEAYLKEMFIELFDTTIIESERLMREPYVNTLANNQL